MKKNRKTPSRKTAKSFNQKYSHSWLDSVKLPELFLLASSSGGSCGGANGSPCEDLSMDCPPHTHCSAIWIGTTGGCGSWSDYLPACYCGDGSQAAGVTGYTIDGCSCPEEYTINWCDDWSCNTHCCNSPGTWNTDTSKCDCPDPSTYNADRAQCICPDGFSVYDECFGCPGYE